jgi:hypothetical protein
MPVIPEGYTGLLHDRCRPDQCRISMIGIELVGLRGDGPVSVAAFISSQKTDHGVPHAVSTPGECHTGCGMDGDAGARHGWYSVGDVRLWGIDHTWAALKSIRVARPDGAPT